MVRSMDGEGLLHRVSWIAGLVFFAFWLYYSSSIRGLDSDLGWHLKAGQLILSTHSPIWTDVFSWSAQGRPWVDHEWLGEVVLALLDRLGGLGAIRFAYWLLLAGNFVAMWSLFRRSGCPAFLASFSALAIGFQAYWQLWPRMQGFTLLGMSLTMLVLQAWWQGRSKPWHMVAYPLGVMVWANLHGGVLAGPASCALVLAAEAVQRLFGRKRERLGFLAALTGLSWLAVLLNPHGVELVYAAFGPLLDPNIRAMNRLVDEWGFFDWHNRLNQISLVWASALVLMLAMARKASLGPLVLALAWGVLGMNSQRNLSLAAIATAPLAAEAMSALLGVYARRSGLVRGGLALLAAAFAVVLLGNSTTRFLFTRGYLPNLAEFPSPAALLAVTGAGPSRLLNYYDWGGTLILAGYPRLRVFIDGRQYVYGLAVNQDYLTMMAAAPGWRDRMERYGIDAIFAPPDVALLQELQRDSRWHVRFQDDTAVFLAK